MNRQEQLKQWLGNRQRNYADGVALFNALAKKVQKEKYGDYFKAAPRNPHLFDPHYTQLINVLTKIEREIRESPELYPTATETIVTAKEMDEQERNSILVTRQKEMTEHEKAIYNLREKISELENDAENNADEIYSLQEQIEDHQTELNQLRQDVDALNTPGVKIVTESSMPVSIKKAYARIKEIAPLYASLHNDIANESLSEDERKPLAEKLCKLDDERRRLWNTIDFWAEGKGTLSLDAEQPSFSDNPVVRGIELARHVKRLKQNIANSKKAAAKAQEDGRQVVYENAMKRIAGYQADLDETEKEIAGEKISE